jgi:anti-sigma regulatory factor (Ser/Thr protein kinase)
VTLELRASPEEVMRAVEALQEYLQSRNLPERTAFGLALALEECGSNIVNHALRRDAGKTFQVSFQQVGDQFIIELRDCGPAFDPTAVPAQVRRGNDADVPGGWGIELVRRYIDEIQYTRNSGENMLRLTKRLGAAREGSEISEKGTDTN